MTSSSAISGVNFSGFGGIKVSAYNKKDVDTTANYKSQTYEDIIDYGEMPTYEQYKPDISPKAFFEEIKDKNDWGKVAKKGASNAIFYTGTSLFDKAFLNNSFGTNPIEKVSDFKILLCVQAVSSIFKIASGSVSGKDVFISFMEGFSKPLIKECLEVSAEFVSVNVFKSALPKYDTEAIKTITSKGMKMGRVYKNPSQKYSLFSGGSEAANKIFTEQMFNSMKSMGISCGVDYVASLGVNVITGFLDDGKFDWDEAKLGSTLLKSSWKTVCATAFEFMGTCGGPAGKKIGKTIGNIVGATIGDFLVEVFDGDEGWCAAAGIATIAGAAAGGIVATLMISGAAIAISVPVAGWIVGGAIIIGAAIGTFAVWLCKTLFG